VCVVMRLKGTHRRTHPGFVATIVIPDQSVRLPSTNFLARHRSAPPRGGRISLESGSKDAAHKVKAEEANSPQANHARECQQHADDGVAAPARVAERSLMSPSGRARRLGFGPGCAFQRSGSLSLRKIKTARSAGSTPITNIQRQPLGSAPDSSRRPRDNADQGPPSCCPPPTARTEAIPGARGRARSGITSRPWATPTANSPPTAQAGQEAVEGGSHRHRPQMRSAR